MSIEAGRLLDVSGVGDPITVLQTNMEVLEDEVNKFVPSYQSGVATTTIGAPTTGTHILDELWKDAWNGVFRCTVAGTPGTWRQERPAIRAGEPGSGTIPTGYIIEDSTDDYRRKVHLGSYVWRYVHAAALYTELTGLTGGGSTNLDGVTTTTLDVGALAMFLVSGALETYRLRSGTDAEASPWVVRPDDYNASTNARVWERLARADYPGSTVMELTGLTGSTVADLNYIPTTGMTVGQLCWFLISGSLVCYRLRSGTDATNSPTVIRPIDFQSVTNPKVWERLAIVATPGDIMIGNNNLSEVASTAAKRTSSRGNIDVLWADDAVGASGHKQAQNALACYHSTTAAVTGATGVNLGTSDFTVLAVFRPAEIAQSHNHTLFQSHSSGNNRVVVKVNAASIVQVVFTDSGGSTATYSLTLDVSLTAEEQYIVCVTVDRDGNATAYVNGTSDRDLSGSGVTVDVSGSSAVDIGSGNASVWSGALMFGNISALRVFNSVLSATDVRQVSRQNIIPRALSWGALSATYTADWSAGDDSWTVTSNMTATGNIDAVSDGSTSKDNTLRLEPSTANGQHNVGRNALLNPGRRIRVTITYYIPSGQTTNGLLVTSAGSASGETPPRQKQLSTTGAWTTETFELQGRTSGTDSGTYMYFYSTTGSGTTSYTGIAGEYIYISAMTVTYLGAILDMDFNNCYPGQSTVLKDQSTNAYDATVTTTVAKALKPVRQFNTERLTVGGATVLTKLLSATATLDFGSIAAAASSDLTITVTGAATGDAVAIGLPASPAAGIVFFGFVSATNTVTVRAMNITGSAVDPASATYRATVFQF